MVSDIFNILRVVRFWSLSAAKKTTIIIINLIKIIIN